MSPRPCLFAFALCMLALCPLDAAVAQGAGRGPDSYPTRPIRLVVPFAPGGSSDTITRVIGPKLAGQLGLSACAAPRMRGRVRGVRWGGAASDWAACADIRAVETGSRKDHGPSLVDLATALR